ncbi:MAG: choline transporter [Lasallia pustulata]|uniref:Choline transporter n=1 Tax=Lasallia pustulata TaxID=136370 RepID=A0A5M8PVW4_9LECA|nr:MAG: choline transporter [Lasallia pustulata]
MSIEDTAITRAPSDDHVGNLKGLDADALALAQMGYSQEMKRNFSVLSVLGVGFSLTNSWFGISAALVTGINSGGPILIIYGIILIALISTCVGISLSELASALPNAGGQYFWANELAPKRYANFASYLTGWFAWAGAVFTSASVALAVGSACVGCWQLSHPDFTILPWHVFVAYQVVNTFAFVFNCYGKLLPTIASAALYTSLISFFVILVVVPAKAPSHQDAKFVFANFVNNTGWASNGIAFIVGLVNTNWAFACLDCATHLAEEVHRPEKMIPIAIMGTVAIGFVTSWFYSVSMFFSLNNLDALFATPTLVPILELFHQALGSKAGAIVLESLIIATGIGCQIASHTWQSRLCWSFARDRGLPFGGFLSKVHPALDVAFHVSWRFWVFVFGSFGV